MRRSRWRSRSRFEALMRESCGRWDWGCRRCLPDYAGAFRGSTRIENHNFLRVRGRIGDHEIHNTLPSWIHSDHLFMLYKGCLSSMRRKFFASHGDEFFYEKKESKKRSKVTLTYPRTHT